MASSADILTSEDCDANLALLVEDLENDDINDIVDSVFLDHKETAFNIKTYKQALIKQRAGFTLVNSNSGFDTELKYYHYCFKMDDFDTVEINYILVERGYNQGQLVAHFQEIFASDANSQSFLFLLPKNGLKTDERLTSFKKQLGISKVYFLEDYLFDEHAKKVKDTIQIEDQSFVNPIILENGKRRGLHDILHWITENSESTVAILAGPGGIGKTTVCEKIQHDIQKIYERYIVIFIDPSTFIDAFANINFDNTENYDLYNVYQRCNKADFLIEEDIFNINLQAGNIVIIFDGIDEVVSTLESFNINLFLDQIARVKKRIGKGKILINIRDTYVEDLKSYYDSKKLASITFFDLQPFNKEIVNFYFEKRYPQEPKKTELGIRLLEFYTKTGNDSQRNEYLYRPFVLECICSYLDGIILGPEDTAESLSKFDFDSDILTDDITDFIIFHVCKREFVKKKDNGFALEVDDQVHFMIRLAVDEKGIAELATIKSILKRIDLKDRADRTTDTIKDHPFLYSENERFQFRYSFLKNHFEGIALHKLINDVGYFDHNYQFVNLLANGCNYNSLTFKNIQYRMVRQEPSWEELKHFGKSLISCLSQNDNIYPSEREKAISNLFVLVYHIALSLKYPVDTMINELFGDAKGDVEHFYLIDVPINSKMILDFSDLVFTRSKIENYGLFFSCIFSADTFFNEDCTINKVLNNNLNYRLVSAKKNNFDANIQGDNSVHIVLNLKQKMKHQIEDAIRIFFRCFMVGSSRTVSEKIRTGVLKGAYTSTIDLDLLIRYMRKNDIVLKIVNKEIYLQKGLLRNINTYIRSGLEFRYQKKVVSDLMQYFVDQELNSK